MINYLIHHNYTNWQKISNTIKTNHQQQKKHTCRPRYPCFCFSHQEVNVERYLHWFKHCLYWFLHCLHWFMHCLYWFMHCLYIDYYIVYIEYSIVCIDSCIFYIDSCIVYIDSHIVYIESCIVYIDSYIVYILNLALFILNLALFILNLALFIYWILHCLYFQFFHDSQYLYEDMQIYLSWLNSENMRDRVETLEPNTIIKHIRVRKTL